jgi:hypothetical protein
MKNNDEFSSRTKVVFSFLVMYINFYIGGDYVMFKCMFACRKRIVRSWTRLINVRFWHEKSIVIYSYQVLKHDKLMMKRVLLFII